MGTFTEPLILIDNKCFLTLNQSFLQQPVLVYNQGWCRYWHSVFVSV